MPLQRRGRFSFICEAATLSRYNLEPLSQILNGRHPPSAMISAAYKNLIPFFVKSPNKQEVEFSRPMAPCFITTTPDEQQEILRVAKDLRATYTSCENPLFLASLHQQAHRLLPERLLTILSYFASDFGPDQFGALIFSGLVPLDQSALGSTPETWKVADPQKVELYGFILALMHAAARATPIQQYYQRQGGGFLHSIIPNPAMAETQTGEGSTAPLHIHTEDALLHSSADFLSFLCLRNEEHAVFALYSIRSHDLEKSYTKKMFEPVFKCPPDDNYPRDEKENAVHASAVLTGNPSLPFLRFDPAEQLSPHAQQSPEAKEALQAFWTDAKALIYKDYTPQSGDFIFLNNNLVAHGRSSFVAGSKIENGVPVPCEKRWMLRMMSTADLLKFFPYTRPGNPFLSWEKQYDELFPEEK